MINALFQLLLLPIKLALVLIEVLGRTLAILLGLGMFGFGAFVSVLFPPFILIGAPLCLLGLILVFKAL